MNTPSLSKKKIIGLIVIVLAVALVLAYFFSWRPSNSDYDTASKLVKAVDSSSKTFTVELAAVQSPGDITLATPLKLTVLANTLAKTVEALDSSAPFTRDFALKAAYDKHRSLIDEYKQSATKLADSIKKYTSALSACRAYTDGLVKEASDTYANLLSKCHSALNEARKSESKPLNDAFLNKYTQATSEYITAIDDGVNASDESGVIASQEKINTLSQEISALGEVALDFELPNITASLDELAKRIESQKGTFLR